MKPVLLTLLLSTLAAPAMALYVPASVDQGITAPSGDAFGRRSGRCPHRPEQPLIDDRSVSREGSTCGGV